MSHKKVILMFTYGKHVFSALKSSTLQSTKQLHESRLKKLSPALILKACFSQDVKPRSFITCTNLCYLAETFPRSNRVSSWFNSRTLNYQGIFWLGHCVDGRVVTSAVRTFSTTAQRFAIQRNNYGSSNKTGLIYVMAVFIFMLGGAYAGVPLYKVFCQATGLGGQAVLGHDTSKVENMERVDRPITVKFNADVASSMRWNFLPQQTQVTVLPGETALAFYTARNPSDKPIIGISTYNVLPYDAGQYFNKIQCFCFEEQRLNPNEQVDMPVFFYIDPEFAEDPKMEYVNTITLSYTFFEAREGLKLPLPGYPQPHDPPSVAAS